jgi:methyl-accepting chemotaxis protein
MKVFISNLRATIVSSLKKLQLKQVAIVMLAGFLLMFNTACSSKVADATESVSNPNPYAGQGKMQKEMYDAVQRPAGGMNNYNDDAKYDSDKTQMQNKKYVERAQGNLKNRVDSPKEAVDNLRQENPLGDKLQESAKNVQQSAEKVQKDFAKGTERGVGNIKQNLERASDAAPEVAERAKQNAKGAGKDLIMGGSKDLPNKHM